MIYIYNILRFLSYKIAHELITRVEKLCHVKIIVSQNEPSIDDVSQWTNDT